MLVNKFLKFLILPQYSFLLVLIFKGIFMYEQQDYILEVERAEIVSYNRDYVSFAKIKNFKFNRTHVGINGTLDLKVNLGFNWKAVVQGYKFASNEYRRFPIEFSRNICHSLANNEFGIQNVYRYGNFKGCPIRKGHHFFANYSPDYSKFPPYIPGGRYRMDVKLMYFDIETMSAEAYATVKPIKDFFP